MKIELWPIDRPVPYSRNARKWSDRAIETVASSIREYGFRQPIVVDPAGEIVIGHLRLAAAKSLHLAEVPVHVADNLTPEQIRGLRIADNRTSQEADWDAELLKLEVVDLKALEYDVALTGFTPDELQGLIDGTWEPESRIAPQVQVVPPAGLTDEDATPEAPAFPVSVLGDLWLCGPHRVLCGDSTSTDAIGRLMDGQREDAIVTDPPYGVGVDYGSFEDSRENVADLIKEISSLLLMAPCAVLTPGVPSMWLYPQPAWLMAWVHPAPSGGCPWGFAGVNPILAYGKDPYLAAGMGRRPDSIVSASDREGVEGHPTPKPMNVWAWLVNRVSPKGEEIILDLFGGSGSTLIACEKLGGRRSRLMELGPQYVDVIVNRWQQFTGKKATLEGDGRTFDEIKAQRIPAAA